MLTGLGSLTHKLFITDEEVNSYLPYEADSTFFEAVKCGDVETALAHKPLLKSPTKGSLSEDPIQSMKYHFVISLVVLIRVCIEGGLSVESGYKRAEWIIRTLDQKKDEKSLIEFGDEVIKGLCEAMAEIKGQIGMSKTIVKATAYIYDHLNEKILLKDISDYLEINKSYLCELFKKETGTTVNNYVTKLKIKVAEKMLTTSDYESAYIAEYFSFSSHSHFISTFKKYTGMTPNEFRNKNYQISKK